MHAVLLTLVIAAGADQPADAAVAPQPYVVSTDASSSCDSCGVEACGGGSAGGCGHALFNAVWDWWGPMPQTCYAPRFGCYPGNNRCMHRYPAFHGTYYRQPYNYRNYFDYPWHAQPHEPMGYFTYEKSPSVDETLIPAPPEAPTLPGAKP